MSAIYGIIDFQKKTSYAEHASVFINEYEKYKLERQQQQTISNGFFGCGLQCFTAESHHEVLPIKDDKNSILFTADCLLDNRTTLLEELQISDSSIPDGMLIYQSYLHWKTECVAHLRGVFAFAVYHWDTNEVFLFSDHFANRCLFYHIREGVLYFSTLLFPLASASKLKYKLNERWLIDSISTRTPMIMQESRECTLQDVLKVESGHYIHIKADSTEYRSYWNPVKSISIDRHMTDEKCRKNLFAALSPAISACLRTDGEVGVKLSSGLDSSTIACLAAPMLDKENRKLHSYTSVPLKESTHVKDNFHIDDESTGVLEICQHHPNIIPSFIVCKDKNILNQAEHILDVWELPCCSEQNAVWIDEITQTAAEHGCKILLSGATGNCSISAGRLEDYLIYLLRYCHPFKAYRDFTYFMKKHKGHRRRFVSTVARSIFWYRKARILHQYPDYYQHILTKRELGEQYQMNKRYATDILLSSPIKSIKKMRKEMYFPRAYAQICEIETHNSLSYGILERDPFRNVEFVEFCLSLPIQFFVNKEYDRRLVRDFMKGIIPDSIRCDIRHRGRQSADNAYRISKSWNETMPSIRSALHSNTAQHFLDSEKADVFLKELNADNLIEKELKMRVIVDTYIFSLYIMRLKKYI